MAKLPDIPMSGVQTLRAEAPKVDSGAAVASGISRGLAAGGQAFKREEAKREVEQRRSDQELKLLRENQAKVAANSIFQETRRAHMKAQEELITNFTTDPDADPGEFRTQSDEGYRRAMDEARKDADHLTRKYLDPQLDAYHTQLEGITIKAERSMVVARTGVELEFSLDGWNDDIREDPYQIGVLVDAGDQQLADSGIYAPDKLKQVQDANAERYTITAVSSFIDADDPLTGAEVLKLMRSRLSDKTHAELEGALREKFFLQIDEDVEYSVNQMLSGKMDLADVDTMVEDYIGDIPGLTDSQRDSYTDEYKAGVGFMYLDGLNKTDRHQEVLDALDSGVFDTRLSPKQKSDLLGRAHTGAETRTSISLTLLSDRANDEFARALSEGTMNNAPFDELTRMIENGELTEAQEQRANMLLEKKGVVDSYMSDVSKFSASSSAQIQQYVNTMPDYADKANYRLHADVQAGIRKQAAAHIEGRKIPGAYAIENNAAIRENYNTMWANAADKDAFRQMYAQHDADVREYMASIGEPMFGRSTVPANDTRFATLITNLQSGQHAMSLNAAVELVDRLGGKNAIDAAGMYSTDATAMIKVAAVAEGDPTLVDHLSRGQSILDGKKQISQKEYNNFANMFSAEMNTRLPPDVIAHLYSDNNAPQVVEALMALTAFHNRDKGSGISSDAFILAQDRLIGPVFNLGSGPSVTYERQVGEGKVRVAPEEVQSRLLTMARNPEQAQMAGFIPYTPGTDGKMVPVPAVDYTHILMNASYRFKGGSTYNIVSPYMAAGGMADGMLMDSEGKPLVIDFEAVQFLSSPMGENKTTEMDPRLQPAWNLPL